MLVGQFSRGPCKGAHLEYTSEKGDPNQEGNLLFSLLEERVYVKITRNTSEC